MARNWDEDIFLGLDPVEVHAYMLERAGSVPVIGHHSPQLKHRSWMVEWIGSACHRFSLTTTCLHLSVLIMDLFMDNFIIDDEQLHLLAISCVQISAKYEEKEVDIPRPRDLVSMIKQTYSNSLCMKMELIVLKHLNWNVGLPTCSHFCDYYMEVLVESTDMIQDERLDMNRYDKAKEICQEYLTFFLDLVIKDLSYRKYKSSLLSSAVMAAIRSLVDLMPVWPYRLEMCTSFALEDISEPLQHILTDYESAKEKQLEADTEKENPLLSSPSYSSGYESRTPSPLCPTPSAAMVSSSSSRQLDVSMDYMCEDDLISVDIVEDSDDG